MVCLCIFQQATRGVKKRHTHFLGKSMSKTLYKKIEGGCFFLSFFLRFFNRILGRFSARSKKISEFVFSTTTTPPFFFQRPLALVALSRHQIALFLLAPRFSVRVTASLLPASRFGAGAWGGEIALVASASVLRLLPISYLLYTLLLLPLSLGPLYFMQYTKGLMR
jgi:hypothetical protein